MLFVMGVVDDEEEVGGDEQQRDGLRGGREDLHGLMVVPYLWVEPCGMVTVRLR